MPAYTGLFLKSCANNQCIEATLILDRAPRLRFPSNVKWLIQSPEDIASRINRNLGLSLERVSGHKLCDFKPHYGLVFQEIIQMNPWWGFCDIDIMFGDLGPWVDLELKSDRDVITAHDRIVAGHFTIIRNDRELLTRIAAMATRSEHWESYHNPTCQMLDEYPFLDFIKTQRLRLQMAPSLPACLKKEYSPYGITFRFDGSVAELPTPEYGFAIWRDGHITYTSDSRASAEVMYLHFMGTKRWWHWLVPINEGGSLHSFSAIGYGYPAPQSKLQWKVFHLLRRVIQAAELLRQAVGKFIRRWLGMDRFLKIRRALISRNRY